MPILSGEVDGRDGHRSDASGDRLRRQMDYSEDETVVVDAPADAYVGSYDEQQPADGNLTLRFGYGGYQQPFPQQYNPYGIEYQTRCYYYAIGVLNKFENAPK